MTGTRKSGLNFGTNPISSGFWYCWGVLRGRTEQESEGDCGDDVRETAASVKGGGAVGALEDDEGNV